MSYLNKDGGIVTLADAATIATDASLGFVFEVTVTADRLLGNPTNLIVGQRYQWIVHQDGTGGWVPTFDTLFRFPGGVSPVLTAAAGAVDIIYGVYDGTLIRCSVVQNV